MTSSVSAYSPQAGHSDRRCVIEPAAPVLKAEVPAATSAVNPKAATSHILLSEATTSAQPPQSLSPACFVGSDPKPFRPV